MKKIILTLICISPLISALWFGYPVKTYRQVTDNGPVYSRRCFKVGELGQFLNCFSRNKIISKGPLLAEMQRELGSLFPYFDVLFFAAVAGACIVIFFS